MTDYTCPGCGPKWAGAYNSDLRCVTCGEFVLPLEPAPAPGDHAVPSLDLEAVS